MDCANVHSYCGRDPEGAGGGGYGIALSDALTRQQMGSGKPVWASENGYKMSGSSNGHPAVTQREQPNMCRGRCSAISCEARRGSMAIS